MILIFNVSKVSKKKMYMSDSGMLTPNVNKAKGFESKAAALAFCGISELGSFKFKLLK